MKTSHCILVIGIISMLFLSGCAANVLSTPTWTPTPLGQMETKIAATVYANQTSTALVEQQSKATLTAAIPSSTDTPNASPTPTRFIFHLPASGCWMNSEIHVQEGQTVVIKASGIINTWDDRPGSSSDPNGQKGICGAIQCPLQGAGYGALIGRLDDLPSFFVGSTLRYTATRDGQLHFTVNDWQCEDNSGVFDILISFP